MNAFSKRINFRKTQPKKILVPFYFADKQQRDKQDLTPFLLQNYIGNS